MKASLLLVLLATSPLAALTLDEFTADKAFWTLDRDKAGAEAQTVDRRFTWTSGAKDTLRTAKGGKILGLNAGETLVRFDAKTGFPRSIEISLYNRGDQGEILEKDFKALLTRASEAVDRAAGVKAQSFRGDRQSAVRADGSIWAGADATYRLEWSKNREDGSRPEFLKLIVFPAGKAAELLKLATDGIAANRAAGGYKFSDHLETTPSGDKWIKDVPMVDQGQKGYCAVASTERVMRLYGLPVDEHDLAQLADSSGQSGTNYAKLTESLRNNAGRLHVRVKPLLDSDEAFFESLVSDYNGAAHKTKAAPLPNPRTNGAAFYSSFKFDNLDGPTLLAGRKKNASGIKRFERIVADQINKGLPILWGVTLGYAPEVPALPQTKGGHMRMIIGYNPGNHTIIYSDSWGSGHERKVMPADTAFAITNEMLVLIP